MIKENYDPANYRLTPNPAEEYLKSSALVFADKIIKEHFPQISVNVLEGASTSSVFLMGSESKKAVLKIYPFPRLAFGELRLFEKWKKLGLPVPGIAHTDFTCSLIPFPYAVMEYIEGKKEDFTDFPETAQVKFLTDLGNILRVAHTITETGFGWVNYHSDLTGDSSWQETIKKIIIGRGKILVEMGIVTHESLLELEKFSASRIPALSKGSLLHGDLTMSNMILADQQINGIIDPDPIVGDGLYDIAYFLVASGYQVQAKHEEIIMRSYCRTSNKTLIFRLS